MGREGWVAIWKHRWWRQNPFKVSTFPRFCSDDFEEGGFELSIWSWSLTMTKPLVRGIEVSRMPLSQLLLCTFYWTQVSQVRSVGDVFET